MDESRLIKHLVVFTLTGIAGNLAYYYGNKQGWSGKKKVLAIVGAFFAQFVLLFLLAAPLALI